MRFFTCLVDSTSRGISDTIRRAYESLPRSRGLPFHWKSVGSVAVLVAGDDAGWDPLVVSNGSLIAVGTVRLDNRTELEQWSASNPHRLTDLELVLRIVTQHGTKYVRDVLGDFAFVVWNDATKTAIVACDAMAVKKVYFAERNGLFAFASRGEALALDDKYNVQYLAELVAACVPSPGHSVYAGVKSLPGGTVAVLADGRLTTRRYWAACDFQREPTWQKSEGEAAETCRDLLAESVRTRLSDDGATWAQLSGGMDSSSIVSVAQWLAARGMVRQGLAGTVSYVDSYGTGADERDYSDAVVSQWGVRNETIVDAPIWHDDQYPPPRIDEPNSSFVFYPRDRRLSAIVRGAGGRVLLTGVGGDNLFTGSMFFFADWIARGRVWPALREMARRAAMGRVSFWELAYRNALLPLLPRTIQRHLVRDVGQLPPWFPSAAARRYSLHERPSVVSRYAGRLGFKYRDSMVAAVADIVGTVFYEVIEDTLDVRHPYLYRPLIEFALRLPPESCARPNARKWVLREAMRDILPDAVRGRVGKAGPYARLAWSIGAQQAVLEPLIRAPMLADLGLVDPVKLRAYFAAAPREPQDRRELHATLHHTLTIEAWLQMRSDRWPRDGHISSAVPAVRTYSPSA